MTTKLDPEGFELQALMEAADFDKACVLEVGTGDGRLALRYAKASPFIVGIDEAMPSSEDARTTQFKRRLRFVQASATDLPFCDEAFDIVLYAWSL